MFYVLKVNKFILITGEATLDTLQYNHFSNYWKVIYFLKSISMFSIRFSVSN